MIDWCFSAWKAFVGRESNSIFLTCGATWQGFPDIKLQWFKDKYSSILPDSTTVVASYMTGGSQVYGDSLVGRVTLHTGDGNLEIKQLHITDTGWYTCTRTLYADSQPGIPEIHVVHLEVQGMYYFKFNIFVRGERTCFWVVVFTMECGEYVRQCSSNQVCNLACHAQELLCMTHWQIQTHWQTPDPLTKSKPTGKVQTHWLGHKVVHIVTRIIKKLKSCFHQYFIY